MSGMSGGFSVDGPVAGVPPHAASERHSPRGIARMAPFYHGGPALQRHESASRELRAKSFRIVIDSISRWDRAMRAMILEAPRRPLRAVEIERPAPGRGQLLLRVAACGVCRTDLHLVDGELPDAKLPVIPGHQIVARVVERGAGATRFAVGDRVGV